MNPGEQLVDTLDELRQMLILLSDRLTKSGIERTNGLRVYMGTDCDYYRRSLDILLRKDYMDIKNLVQSCHDLFNLVEGKKNGSSGS